LTLARAAALGALLVAVVVVGVMLFGGGGATSYDVEFQTAGQLVKDDDVQIGGRRVGSIREITLTDDNQARIRIEVQEPYAPLHEGTQATIRATSLSGVANRYIALQPGPDNAKELAAGSTLKADDTQTIVDLDQLFATFDPDTRKDLQQVIQGIATQYDGRAEEAGQAAEYFNPFLSTSRRLVNELTEDETALTAFIVNSSKAVTALAERRDDIAGLVTNANTTARAVAAEEQSLGRALEVLPQTLRRGNSTFVNLRSTLDDLDVLVAESKPATRRLAPFFRELRPLVAAARPTVADLRKLVSRNGAGNDLVDTARILPGLRDAALPAFRNGREALEDSQPVLEFVRPYAPDLVGWFRDFGFNAAAYDANGHYARIQPIFNAFSFTDNPSGGTLTPQSPTNRVLGLQNGFAKRCPGASTQPAEDGSNPYTDEGRLGPEDCDPSQVPPGP
jgi:phospholipid/cholesterol/gamma-HCH transport system substrate-binding protein